MSNHVSLPKDKELAQILINNQSELDKKRIDQGILGHFWGNSASAPYNVAALSVMILIITGIAYTFYQISTPPDKAPLSIKEFWGIITPLITLAIGYLFGGGKKGEEQA